MAQLGSKIINVLVQLGISMVMARLLTPMEYGTMAILQVFLSLFSILADAGISTAVAQSQILDESDYECLFFLSLLIGIALAIGFFLLSLGIAWFYDNSDYMPLGTIMTFAVIFSALNMVPTGILIKKRKFKLIGMRLVVCTITVGLITVALAYLGFGCYAIAINSVLMSVFLLTWNLVGTRLHMSMDGVHNVFRKVGSFSIYNLANQIIGWSAANSDSLIVGKLFGASALGYYNKAYNLYSYPLSILAAPITDTILPFLAPLQDNKPALCERFQNVFMKISFISALCTAGMNVCAAEIILIMYGDDWAPAIPLLATLAFAVYSRGVNGAFSALLNATGKPDLLMRSTAINTIITLGLIFLGGILGSMQSLATCVSIAYNMEMILPIYFCAHYCLEISTWKFLANFFPDIVSILLIVVIGILIPWKIENIFLSLAAKAIFVCLLLLSTRIILHRTTRIALKVLGRRRTNQ